MDPNMGIDNQLVKMERDWELERRADILKDYDFSSNKLAQRVIELEDLIHTRESQIDVFRSEIKSLENENIALSSQVQGMITQVEHYNKRLIKIRIRSFINSIFSKLGYVRGK